MMKRVLGLLLALVLLVSVVPAVGVSAEEYPGLPFDVDNPAELKLGQEYVFSADRPAEDGYIYFKVKVKETGSLDVVVKDSPNMFKVYEVEGIYTDDYCTDKVNFSLVVPGEYYIRLRKGQLYGYSADKKGEKFKIQVNFMSLGQGTRDGKSMETAFKVSCGETFTWFADSAKQYIQLDFENDTMVKFRGKYDDRNFARSFVVLNSEGSDISKQFGKVNLAFEADNFKDWTVMEFKAGTYYFQLSTMNTTKYATIELQMQKEVDNTPPEKPTSLTYKAGQGKVTGKGEAGCTVYVVVGDKIFSGKVSSKGSFSVDTKLKLKKDDVVRVWLVDKALNQGKYVKVKVK